MLTVSQKRAFYKQRHHWASKKFDKITSKIREIDRKILDLQSGKDALCVRQERVAQDMAMWQSKLQDLPSNEPGPEGDAPPDLSAVADVFAASQA
eukprot:3527553-Pyramimonas_sp.AAC.1